MERVKDLPIEIRRGVQEQSIFGGNSETRLRYKSLELWQRTAPLNVPRLYNRILGIHTKDTKDEFLTHVRYLQDEIRFHGEGRLLNDLSAHDSSFIMKVLSRVIHPDDRLIKPNLNVNDISLCVAQNIVGNEELKKDKPYEVATRGASAQRVLVYSFLHMAPEELSAVISQLVPTTEMFVRILDKGLNQGEARKGVYSFILGAATAAMALLATNEFSDNPGGYVFPAPDLIDLIYAVDGFRQDYGKIVSCIQSSTAYLGNPNIPFGSLVNGEPRNYKPKVTIFGEGRSFMSLVIPLRAHDKYEDAKRDESFTRNQTLKLLHGSELSKLNRFLRGMNSLVMQGLLPKDILGLLYLADFRNVTQAVNSGQYPLKDFVTDIGEHIRAIKQNVAIA